jgi:hypothetical protein
VIHPEAGTASAFPLARAAQPAYFKPDIRTSDALKQTLLKAESIATIPASAAGTQVLRVLDVLRISEAMKAKIRPQPAERAGRPSRWSWSASADRPAPPITSGGSSADGSPGQRPIAEAMVALAAPIQPLAPQQQNEALDHVERNSVDLPALAFRAHMHGGHAVVPVRAPQVWVIGRGAGHELMTHPPTYRERTSRAVA